MDVCLCGFEPGRVVLSLQVLRCIVLCCADCCIDGVLSCFVFVVCCVLCRAMRCVILVRLCDMLGD